MLTVDATADNLMAAVRVGDARVARPHNIFFKEHDIGSQSNYALRLPISLKAGAEKVAREDGSTLNQFIANCFYKAQFSSLSACTRSNSPVLLVTSVQSSASAWQAIHRSLAPICVPAVRSRVNCTA